MSHPAILSLILSICSILAGIYLFANGLNHIMRFYLEMVWMHIQVSNRADNDKYENIKYNFSNGFMGLCATFPILGLSLVLVGIKYLPT